MAIAPKSCLQPSFDLLINNTNLQIKCPKRLTTPKFVPWDLPGRCTRCKDANNDTVYELNSSGLVISSHRLRGGPKFVAFDNPADWLDQSIIRIRSRNKALVFPLEIKPVPWIEDAKFKRNALDLPSINLCADLHGLYVYCGAALSAPLFVPWDLPGQCSLCRSNVVEVDYCVQPLGVTLFCSRLKEMKFVHFDVPTYWPDRTRVPIKY